jgi:hypothetical protein
MFKEFRIAAILAMATICAVSTGAEATSVVRRAVDGVPIVGPNIRGASREHSFGDKAVRGVYGISNRDMRRRGISGGSNSVVRKPLGKSTWKKPFG